MARLSRYSRWDGTQAVPDLDADELLSAMSDDLLAEGDLMSALEQLPPDPAGQIKELQNYPFHSAEAKQKFDELMKSLQEQMLKPFMQGMQQGLQSLTPEDLKRMREMMPDLNQMLRERAQGGEPDFQAFKD